MSSAVVVFVSLCGLLVAGKFVRIKVPLLQRLYLPSSVIGGLWTAFAFTLVIDWGWMKVFAVSCVMLAFWIGCAIFRSRRNSS